MRPIKLRVAAFGPYAETQTVDFRDATDAGLFGIYGPTGSGKSSIFSAMTFALFGEASKKEQPIVTLRSAHASADLLTEVAFVFELGAKRYLVRRQPEQSRPKVRGEGETSQAHAAWLFDVTDIEIDAIDLDGDGVVLAEKKVGLVTDRVKDLLGYGAEQFRQIVLLPQGRFEKFLTSDSSERLKILRELFDVSLYRALTERLKEEAIAAKREVQDGYRIHAGRLDAEGFASSDELDEGIAEARKISAEAAADSSAKEKAASKAEQAYLAAQTVEARFAEAERAKETLAGMQEQQAEIAETRLRRENALRAQRASDIAAAIDEADARQVEAVEREELASTAALQTQGSLQDAEEKLKEETERSGEVAGLQRRLAELERYQQALVDAEDLKSKLDQSVVAKANAEQARDGAVLELDRLTKFHEETEAAYGKSRQDDVERLKLQGRQGSLDAKLKQARAHAKANEALERAQEASDQAESDLTDAQGAHTAAKSRHDEAETAYFSAQASILAHRLEDGEPCPVCGAAEHPSPAHAEGDPSALEGELNQARDRLSDAADRFHRASVAQSSAKSRLDEKASALSELDLPETPVSDLEQELAQVEKELADLGEPTDLQALQDALQDAKEQKDQAALTCAEADKTLQTCSTAEAVARRSYEDHIADVPESYRDPAELREAHAQVVRSIELRKQALSDADDNARAARELATTANADLKNATKEKADAQKASARAREHFAARLAELRLTAEQYEVFVGDIPLIESLTSAVDAFEAALREASGAARQATDAIKDVERPDIPAILSARDDARLLANEATEVAATLRARLAGLEKLKEELSDELARLRQLEEATGPLRTLADAFSGQNEMNTTLESFAIGAMFDQVLEAANLRLEPMTSGRYRLERDVESSGGRSKRGLDIRVHDIETGRARDLTTLSGGETFIAALSLALGLSDIVESSHGAIRLDTIFIDEGFGSLDTENDAGTLDRVLQVLQDIVGASRSVGLISHVQLVQQAVPTGFSILKGIGGSTIEKRAA